MIMFKRRAIMIPTRDWVKIATCSKILVKFSTGSLQLEIEKNELLVSGNFKGVLVSNGQLLQGSLSY